jgi:hypothetical protein
MAVEPVSELQLLAEAIEGFVAPEALELGEVDAAIHPSGKRTTLEAVAGEVAPGQAGCNRARLDDFGNQARGERRLSDLGQGRGRVFRDL